VSGTGEDALRHILDTGTDILITDHGMGGWMEQSSGVA
jgi:hypothetical protein